MTLGTRDNLLRAATRLMLTRGYNGTTVDEICAAAGTTKGAFFHHFKNKDDLGLATLDRYADRIFSFMREGADLRPDDPVGRVYDYIDTIGRKAIHEERRPACLLAIQAMELGAVRESFRARCAHHFRDWQQYFEGLLDSAIQSLPHPVEGNSEDLAHHFIGLFEGSILLARAHGDGRIVESNLRQYRGYLEQLFAGPRTIN